MGGLIIESSGHVVTATMAAPERRNVLSVEVMDEIVAALDAAERAAVRAFVIRAEAGAKTWSSGHDIADLPRSEVDPAAYMNPIEAFLARIRSVPFPVIAAVEGGAWGGACDLAFTCDLLVATRSATFAVSPAKLGIPYNRAGVAHFVSALPLNVAREMFFTAEPVSAERLAAVGVVNRLVDDTDGLAVAVQELVDVIAARAPLAIRAIKAEIVAQTEVPHLDDATTHALEMNRVTAWRSADYQEGLRAFDERRSPDFNGA